MRENKENDSLVREFLLGFVKLHALHHASKERIYGSEFQAELERHGYCLSFGTIYPVFHKLEKAGYLSSARENAGGRVRKYYSITPKGRRALAYSRARARELFMELEE